MFTAFTAHWTIGKKLYTVFGGMLAVVIALGGYGTWSTSTSMTQFRDAMNGPVAAKVLGETLEAEAYRFYASEKGMTLAVLNGDPNGLEKWGKEANESQAAIADAIAGLTGLAVESAAKARAQEASQARTQMNTGLEEVTSALKAGNGDLADQISQQKILPAFERLRAVVRAVTESNNQAIEAGLASANRWYGWMVGICSALFFGAMLMGAIGVYSVWRINLDLRSVASSLREGSERLVTIASQVSGSADGLARGSTEQAATLEESSASMEEMSSMTRRNAESAGQASILMAEVKSQVEDSNRSLEGMVTSMAEIRESSARVGKIIKTIDEIAFQTNILALNAAVEAARAGEAGMGFAVVADEVRNLARAAAQAARDTTDLIEGSRASAERGGQMVEQVAASIATFTSSVAKVQAIAEQVSTASGQQAQGIEQVSQAIAQLEKTTQTSAATSEEGAAASEELGEQARSSGALVERLDAMVGRAGTESGRGARRRAPHAGVAAAPSGAARPGRTRAA
jgi:methyl-accepting chemotaxis protein